MKPLFLSLRKLQWQLSLFYLMVTLITIPALLGMVLMVILLNTPSPPSPSSPSPGEQLVQVLETHVAPAIIGQIQQHPSDSKLLTIWATNFMRSPVQFGLNGTQIDTVIILNQQQQILASASAKGKSMSSQEFSKNAEGLAIINAAFANSTHVADLYSTSADGQTISAVPLLNAQGHPTDVLYVVVRGLPVVHPQPTGSNTNTNPVADWLPRIFGEGPQGSIALTRNILFAAICIILAISTTFGILTARRITRRLRRVTSAAHAWSQGQFQVTIPDRSPDELGQLAQDLNQMALQVQTLLNTRQQLTLLEERQRVARDLHDSVKQHTFAMTLLIGAGKKYLGRDPAQAHRYLTEAEELADQTRQELTTIIQELRPLALTEKGLATALGEYIHQWSRHAGIEASVSAQEMPFLLPEQGENLFRVTQEALTNVMRHSKASKVSVCLSRETEQVCLTIRDNGQGFDVVKAAGKGLGLATMRERIETSLGTVCISSTNEGTMVEVHMPCTGDDHHLVGNSSSKEMIDE